MYPAVECEAKVVYKEPLLVDEDYLFMTVFTGETPTKKNAASECIHTVAATCGCKILQPYEYNECGYEGYEGYCK